MSNGYMGKILWVNLTTREIKEETLDEQFCRDYIGGYGMASRLIYSRQKAGTDPLGPDAIFGLVTGVLTGTGAMGGTRYFAVGKSPLTGGWGDANSGGYFGPHMRFAGYDAVFFTGIADKPVYLFIDNGKAELRDAGHLWGKDSFDTEDALHAEVGNDAEVCCIGPSGEQQSLIAAIMNNHGRAAARSGLGAVMGSKKLKAVAVKGSLKIPVPDEKAVMDLRKKQQEDIGGHAGWLKDYGTPFLTVGSVKSGDAPIKNWAGAGEVDFPDADPIGGDAVIARQTKKYACYRCFIACGGRLKEGTGEYKYAEGTHKPEYETLAFFGPSCLNNNLDSIIKANDICNRYGLDTISAGSAVAFAIDCYENGLITKEDTGGIEMTWGNHKSIVAMTEMMAKREGFGALLADGTRVAAAKIGKGADEMAIQILGEELPAHDPKFMKHFATTYIVDATPGRHTQGSEAMHPADLGPEFDKGSWGGRAEAHKVGACFAHVVVSAGLCVFYYWNMPSAQTVTDSINSVTGWNVTTEDLIKVGERIANLRQAFNVREGVNLLDFKVPGRITGQPPHKQGPLTGVTIPLDDMVMEYLGVMDWDTETAKPNKKKLLELGLEDVAKELWP